mmetsp:Transcript_36553/g.108593  ORF Transcript_36553/g.108593 Transcript_36553/m.108593 type:complete len:221 (+) Transcript_36553:1423-2085(+)
MPRRTSSSSLARRLVPPASAPDDSPSARLSFHRHEMPWMGAVSKERTASWAAVAARSNECDVKKERCSWYAVSNWPSSCMAHCDVWMKSSVRGPIAAAQSLRNCVGEGTCASTFCATIASSTTGLPSGGHTLCAPQKPTLTWCPLATAVGTMLAAGSTPYVFQPSLAKASSCEPSLHASSSTARLVRAPSSGSVSTSAWIFCASHSKCLRSVLDVPETYM